jgi:DNA mismatch repair protein MSH4
LLNPSTQTRQALQRDIVVSSGRHQLLLPSHEDLYASEAEMNKILMLKQYLASIHEIHSVLELAECQSNICDWVRQTCSPEMLDVMRAILDENIEQDAVFSRAPIDIRNNRIWAVKVCSPRIASPQLLSNC